MSPVKIGVVTAVFNSEVTFKLEEGALKALVSLGVTHKNIVSVRVPGAFEIPLAVKKLFEDANVDGVVALGAVIRGETSHYDYVCSAVERGCTHLALQFGKPVGFGVLTTENEAQALARAGGTHGHKGAETASSVIDMCNLLKALKNRATDKAFPLDASGQAGYNL
jgi:6,7-dimethyl-8-ribityllumazine synthase